MKDQSKVEKFATKLQMVWSPAQRVRLAIEKKTLEKCFRLGVSWIDPENETKVDVLLKSNSDREFKLRIYIPNDFPSSCPPLVVVSPDKLYMKNGQQLPEMSDDFHTLEYVDNFHRICHFYPPLWTPDITLDQVFMKGRIWIEAYEAHLDTGKNMNVFLKEQRRSNDVEDQDDNVNGNLRDGNRTSMLREQRYLHTNNNVSMRTANPNQNSSTSLPVGTSSPVNNQPRQRQRQRYIPRGGVSLFQPGINEMVRRTSLSHSRHNSEKLPFTRSPHR